jgi:hypothetical protein
MIGLDAEDEYGVMSTHTLTKHAAVRMSQRGII